MLFNENGANIAWITSQRFEDNEWAEYTKSIIITEDVREAVFRLETDCTCGIYINGEFIVSATGRLPERVVCREITSKLIVGVNKIKLVLGGPYFQAEGVKIKKQRGYWLNSAAFELCLEFTDGAREFISTDSSWTGFSGGKKCETIESMRVTEAEYDTMWKNAALWVEADRHKMPIPPEVISVAGSEYKRLAKAPRAEYYYPVKTIEASGDGNSVIYDFGRLIVGFTEIEYTAGRDTAVRLYHDFTERATDFDENADWKSYIDRLSVVQPLLKGNSITLNLRRRAFRFLKIELTDSEAAVIKGVRVKPCMFPAPNIGYFTCNDEILTKAWNVGKYTLHVNKQQEYESCPRNEMEFFSGDGAIDELVDNYAFGEDTLINASLSVKEDIRCGGIAFTSKFNKSTIQWDYFAWRIICIYIHYKAHGDKEFLKTYFDEAETALLWQLERRNKYGLIFQKPCFVSTFGYALGQTEWTCSPHRLGEKVALNALLYESLKEMSEMASALGNDEKASKWRKLATDTKRIINERLWNDEKHCYMDSLDTFIAQDGNVLAVLFGIAEGERASQTLKTVQRELWSPYGSTLLSECVSHVRDGSKTISPLMDTYECMALFEHNMPAEALELMRRCWGTMIKKGAETFWEFSPNDATSRWDIPSHAWSSGCTYLLSKYVLGVRATEADCESILFQPNVCDLTSFRGVVPTKFGFIAVSYELFNNKKRFTVALPKAITLEYSLPENSLINIIRY